MLGFLFKLCDLVIVIGDHDAETTGFLHGYRHNRDGYIGIILLVEIQHYFIIHFIDVISGKDQHIIRIICINVIQILVNRIRCSGIPFAVCTLFIWREYGYAAHIAIQIPRHSNSDMGVQTQRLILRQNSDRIYT